MAEETKSLNFIEQIVEDDLANGLDKSKLRFRFPPEPNGYLHIGHAASICLNFGLGLRYNAPVNLRFDDTNPAKEEQEYVDAIKNDVQWLGFKWDQVLYSSDYFQQLYDWTIDLINDGKAYVDEQSSEEIREQKGTPTSPGTNSPYRDRPISENLELFQKMKDGAFDEGAVVLRAKIDMQHNNMHMRDPILYRVLKKSHHRTGDDWCIYPMYDWTHGESDYLEQISHSFCTLEFKSHRELYDWYLDQVVDSEKIRPKQREFARRNLSYTVMSKRKLLQLVESGAVNGWDDPRMPTISGLRRRGYTPESIVNFSKISGIAKRDSITDVALLEFCIRDYLNKIAPRVMAVLDPLKIVITNYPEDKEEFVDANYNDYEEGFGSRAVPFSREIYIEKEDFREEANKKFFRLKLGGEVRLKNTYIIKANEVIKDSEGNIIEVHCTYDEDSKSGSGTEASKRKVKGTLHWVSIKHAEKVEVRLYDRLFTDEAPDGHKERDFKDFINPNSLAIGTAFVEPSLKNSEVGDKFQFQRKGYFCVDTDSNTDKLIFNKTVGLKDSFAKIEKKASQPAKNDSFEKVGPLAGKYLKARSDEDKNEIKSEIAGLSQNISFNFLLSPMQIAKSNKEILACLLVLGSGIEITENKEFDGFITNILKSNNSTIKVEGIKYILNNTMLKTKFNSDLNTLKTTDKNSYVRNLLEEQL
ncbi:glutamine--tRNA ligase/YqeY domain fusion protein [Urechidicola vernalis]|uniref:Glutamine--tRNA ligase n=1 Tax=Urechidicola vernalis TaxID=3075600 RepID=A0ABU2Y5A0_9FLAO|nr:glutamine--tRNA ligase/YqeY domain fusion protein [Urechidicola sp. P050]MDT0553340.1 glutamine--tRNA ligase/YqeY domain fusion protein [Urechidicola sp. P050]